MKIRYIYIAISLSFIVSLGGCTKDFLELTPRTSQVKDTYYQNSEQAYRALIGIYSELRSTRYAQSLSHIADVMSDDSYPGGGSASDYLDLQRMGRFTASSRDGIVSGLWNKGYTAIQRSNSLLINYDGIAYKESEADIKKTYKAEALALRAHFYFMLVRHFENIPLLLEPLSGEEWRGVTQSTPDVVYAQIAKDFTDAIPDMLTSHSSESLGRLTQWSAKAELLKVYMFYTGVYSKTSLPIAGGGEFTKTDAINLAKDIIDNSGAVLETDFSKLFTVAGDYNSEVLFEVPFGDTGSGDWNGGSFLGNYGVQAAGPRDHNSSKLRAGWGFFLPTHELYEAFESGDARRDAAIMDAKTLIDDGGLSPSYTHTGLYSFKYTTHMDRSSTAVDYALNWAVNWHYIRLSDVMLLYAELLLGSDDATALQMVNAVRNRAGLSPLGAVNLDVIYVERRTELALEGHRYFDLLRRGLTYAKSELDVANYTLYPPTATGKTYESEAGDNMTGDIGDPSDFVVTFDAAKKGFLPIPQGELDLVSSLKQNDGY